MHEIKYTAFVDVLGFSDFIKDEITNKKEADKFYTDIKRYLIACLEHFKYDDLNPIFENEEFMKNIKFDYIWISDTFVISIENNNSINSEEESKLRAMMIYILSLNVSYVNFYFINEYKICIRGGITSKFTYLKDRIILGEGISEANNLEKNLAVNPRVIFSQNIITNDILKNLHIDKSPTITKDCDGYYFVNYLNVLNHTPPICGKSIRISSYNNAKKIIDLTIKNHKNIIIENIEKHKYSVNILAKYLWLKEYHNRYINENLSSDLLIK